MERYKHTLKARLNRYMIHHHTSRWKDVIKPIVDSYNRTDHRSIGVSPNDVNADNKHANAHRLYSPRLLQNWLYRGSTKVVTEYVSVKVKTSSERLLKGLE